MSFSTKLQKIRAKPQHVKERMLIVSMAMCVAVVMTVWFSTFSMSSLKLNDVNAFFKDTKTFFTREDQYSVFEGKLPANVMESIGAAGTSTQKQKSNPGNVFQYTDTVK